MVTEDPVDVNLTMSPSLRKIPALLTKNSAQPCQIESSGEIIWIRVRPTDDDDSDPCWSFCGINFVGFIRIKFSPILIDVPPLST